MVTNETTEVRFAGVGDTEPEDDYERWGAWRQDPSQIGEVRIGRKTFALSAMFARLSMLYRPLIRAQG